MSYFHKNSESAKHLETQRWISVLLWIAKGLPYYPLNICAGQKQVNTHTHIQKFGVS